jgi:hypothetical protein
MVVATHWHDDHIRGISDALKSFPNATFVCSSALHTEHFLKLVAVESESLQGNSGVAEFGKILQLILERKRRNFPARLVSPDWAIQNRRLLNMSASEKRSFGASLTALSPSDGTAKMAFERLAQLIPRPGDVQKGIPNLTPNSTSIALWVEVGTRRALLGADLEHTGNPGEGWLAVLDKFQQTGEAALIKVPHHGSPNADCPELWKDILIAEPLAVLAPFSSGRGLPQPSDLDRLKKRTPNVYCTAPLVVKLPKRDKLVEKMLRGRERRATNERLGHVRVRWSAGEADAQPEIELFDGAFRA